jgi:hypothetical protein
LKKELSLVNNTGFWKRKITSPIHPLSISGVKSFCLFSFWPSPSSPGKLPWMRKAKTRRRDEDDLRGGRER